MEKISTKPSQTNHQTPGNVFSCLAEIIVTLGNIHSMGCKLAILTNSSSLFIHHLSLGPFCCMGSRLGGHSRPNIDSSLSTLARVQSAASWEPSSYECPLWFCACISQVCSAHGGLKRASDPLELKLLMTGSYPVGAGIKIQVLYKSSQCSSQWHCLSSFTRLTFVRNYGQSIITLGERGESVFFKDVVMVG